MSNRRQFKSPSECPVCGAAVPAKARACPECGADERTGWNDEATRYDGLDLPAEAFDDQVKGSQSGRKMVGILWWAVGIGMALLIGGLVFIGRF